jgi:serpin B
MQTISDGSNRFALDLYGKLREKPGNLFFSPYSIHAALAMTADGANGTTRDQMVKVLHLPADREKALAAGDLGRFYAAGGRDYELSVANALWGQKGFRWRPEFLARQNERFGAGFNEADFARDPEAERVRINGWVEDKTRDKIKELLQPGIITSQTTMVLTNAIYFKGQWAEQFDKRKTRDGEFRLADGKTVSVPLMHHSGTYRHGDFDGTQVLEMPYKGGDLSMVVILPEKPDGLSALEKQLTADQLTTWIAGLHSVQHFDVTLPRFKMTWGSELLNDQLRTLGMTEAFGGGADFTGMAGASPGSITAVVHKAFVDVNEEGTEAAAATAVAIGRSAPRGFRADRPFLFLIRDAKHGTILFLGRLTDPSR